MFDSQSLSSLALAFLKKAGWFPGRQVSTAAAVRLLDGAGISKNSAAIQFIAEFDQLQLKTPSGGVSSMAFDVAAALEWLSKRDCVALERITGESVCPVGYGGRMFSFITPTHRMLFLQDEWLVVVGTKSINHGIEMICSQQFAEYDSIQPTDDQLPSDDE